MKTFLKKVRKYLHSSKRVLIFVLSITNKSKNTMSNELTPLTPNQIKRVEYAISIAQNDAARAKKIMNYYETQEEFEEIHKNFDDYIEAKKWYETSLETIRSNQEMIKNGWNAPKLRK